MAADWVAPDACTLPTAEQPVRVAEFDDLFSREVAHVVLRSPTHLTLSLRGAADLETRVSDLVARESACCSFFSFTVDSPASAPGEVTLDIEVPTQRQDVLTALANRVDTLAGRRLSLPARPPN